MLGAEDAEQLSLRQEGNSLFRAYAIENADSDRPRVHRCLSGWLKQKGAGSVV